jgi:hypothetical protein
MARPKNFEPGQALDQALRMLSNQLFGGVVS